MSRPLTTTTDTERDACGIGFVATETGEARREVLDKVLGGLACVKHRGALAADAKSSDGAGILVPLDGELFASLAIEAGVPLPGSGELGVAAVFMSNEPGDVGEVARGQARRALEEGCKAEDLEVLGWRRVPINENAIGDYAKASMPRIEQLFFATSATADGTDAERSAYRARRRAEKAASAAGIRFYTASMSFDSVLYKALCPGDALGDFYPDLLRPEFEVAWGIFHMRFSTNTAPSWERAQPFRMLCHNGEINTIEGNERRMQARSELGAEAEVGDPAIIRPVLDANSSDSGKFDSAVELLVRGGRGVEHALAMMVPQAWENVADIPPAVRDFYRYHSCVMEPWDGPAGLIVSDGRRVAACLDRNGLRPLRWAVSEDGLVMACSEIGAVDMSGHGRLRRGRLGPGQMLCVDPDRGGLVLDDEIKERLGDARPWGRWVEDGLIPMGSGDTVDVLRDDSEARRNVFGWTSEEVTMIVKSMAADGKEPTFSMGDDVPIPAFGTQYRPVHHYLKQRFAQVTNPPIDHLRERLVMSVRTLVGPREPLLCETREVAHLVELPSFIVYPSTVELLDDRDTAPFASVALDCTFAVTEGPDGLEAACGRLAGDARDAVESGTVLLILRDTSAGSERVPVPSLLATGAVHQGLIEAGSRSRASIIVDSDEVKDTHHLATLLGYGADLICPRLAFETVAGLADDGALGDEVTAGLAQERFQAACEDGVLKIMSKMGISTVDGYRGAQIFEAISLGHDVIEACLTGTVSQIGGVSWQILGEQLLERHAAATGSDKLPSPGLIRYRKGGEYHSNNPDVIDVLHESLGLETDKKRKQREKREAEAAEAAEATAAAVDGADDEAAAAPAQPSDEQLRDVQAAHILQEAARSADQDLYNQFAALVNDRPATEPQDLLEFAPSGDGVPLEEVESVEDICARFTTGAMSHGALSREAHETLAVALNMIGGRSNCGEGGEAKDRYYSRGTSRDRNSRIKQIASGRFGVTPEYAMYADELQIKMAQGSKPGEGGQIPGHKVTDEIAELRNTQPGVTLISPPPHHDIYSIEDLAQLIFDLKQVNPNADVSVKLVSVAGVGTIAAGVAKGLAEGVHISGCNGGTGASPLSSIKHAGLPWVLGLAETQQALMENGLRGRIRVSVDGALKTGRDVLLAALLGADEYSFGTAALMAEGCVMVRACHRDTCPTGIATQREQFRKKFVGTPEMVAAYLRSVAQETRELLASLGLRSIDEAIGRTDFLRQKTTGDERLDSVDLSPLLVVTGDAARRYTGPIAVQKTRSELGDKLLTDAFRALWEGDVVELDYEITNVDRTVGAALAGAVALEFSDHIPPGYATVEFKGTAGQSFGAFLANGIDFRLTGEANDYVGKAMAGGRIVVTPPENDAGDPFLVGNTVLYGATGGELFVAGSAGERFGVRNSGAVSVVEGVGLHCAEYMTGGTIVVLGDVGENLGAGMSGGRVFAYDPDGRLPGCVNTGMVKVMRPNMEMIDDVRQLIERHQVLTGSQRAASILDNWDDNQNDIWAVLPLSAVRQIEEASQEVSK